MKSVGFGLFFVFLSISSTLLGQNSKKADSLIAVYNSGNYETESAFELLRKIAVYANSPTSSIKYSDLLLSLAEEEENELYKLHALLNIGISHRLLGNLSKSFETLFVGAEIALTEDEYSQMLSKYYTEIATCYTLLGNQSKAIEYGEKAIQLLEAEDPTISFAISNLNLGYDYFLINDYESALKYYDIANKIFVVNQLEIGTAYVEGNAALVYWKQGNLDLAKTELKKAIQKLEELEDTYAISDYSIRLAQILLEENRLNEANQFAEEGVEIAQIEGFKEQLRDAYLLLSNSSAASKDFEASLQYQTLYHSYKDSIYNQETADLLANLNAEFELAKKQAEVDMLIVQRKNNRLIIIAAVLVIVSLLIIAWLLVKYSTSKERLNSQLEEQKTDLIQLNDTKDKFLSIISHDLRGPIGVVSGLAGVMKRDIASLEEDELKQLIHHVDHYASNLVKLLDNHLHWSLQQRGSLPYAPDHTKGFEVCDEVISLFTEMAAEKEIKLLLEADKSATVYVDRNALSTILRNLINNAIKFSDNKTQIKLTFSLTDANLGLFRVTDQGVGMSQDFIEEMLQSTGQISSSGTKGERGLGIGLQLVKEFVQINKGSLQVSSEVGQGTTFEISFPTSA